MAHRRAEVRLLDVGIRRFARPHAVEEVLRVSRRRVEIHLRGAFDRDRFLRRARLLRLELPRFLRFDQEAIVVNIAGALRSAELDVSERAEIFVGRHNRVPVPFEVVEGRQAARRELEANRHRVRNGSVVVDDELPAHRANRRRRFFIQEPANHIEKVNALVRDLRAIFVPPTEFIRRNVFLIRPFGAGPDPKFPIEVFRRRGRFRLPHSVRVHIRTMASPRDRRPPDFVFEPDFRDLAIKRRRTAVNPDLNDALVFSRRFDHRSPFDDRRRERFFAVNVEPGLARLDRLIRVPMVRRRQDDRVDVGAFVNLAEVGFERLRTVAELLRRVGQRLRVDVAKGRDLHIVRLFERLQELRTAVGDAEERESDFIVGAENFGFRRRRLQRGQPESERRRGAALKESSAIRFRREIAVGHGGPLSLR